MLFLSGCTDPANPNIYPTRLIQVYESRFPGVTADFNQDGRDEILLYGAMNEPGVESVLIETLAERALSR